MKFDSKKHNHDETLAGQTNIDRSQSTRQTGSRNSQARWFALSIKFGMTQSGDDNGCNVTKDNDMTPTPSRHPELVSGSKNNDITNNKRIHHDNHEEDNVQQLIRRRLLMTKEQTTTNRSRNEFGMSKRVAFTLAEVLITLGIIGIVAAMTLPTLIHKYQAKVFETRFKKSVAIITEIINRTRYDMGIEDLGEYCVDNNNRQQCFSNISKNILSLKKSIISGTNPYYNIRRTADSSTSEEIYTYNGKSNIKLSTNERAIFYTNMLKDGTFLGFDVGGGTLSFAVDLNGYGKPNRLGQDIFIFGVSKDVNSKLEKYVPNNKSYNNNQTDEEVTEKWENSTSSVKNYNIAIEGMPCNKTSTRAGNGIGCAYYALKNICPDDSTKTYWECLPR